MVIRYNEQAKKDELEVAMAVEKNCKINCTQDNFLDSLDFTLRKDGEVIGFAETKARSNTLHRYPTVFLSVRKWSAFVETGLPGYFIVKFTDGIRVARVDTITNPKIIMAGRRDRVNAPNDIEPIIEVPVSQFKELKGYEF